VVQKWQRLMSCQVIHTSVKIHGYGAVRSCSKLDSEVAGWLEPWLKSIDGGP
jgi:hypothetical protein